MFSWLKEGGRLPAFFRYVVWRTGPVSIFEIPQHIILADFRAIGSALFFQPHLASLRKNEDRDLTVFDAEADGRGEGILGEETGAVEIVEAVGGVEPAADVAVVTHRVAHHPAELLAGVAALRGGIRDDDAFRRLSHRGKVHREAVRMPDTVCPHAVRHGLYTATH